MVDSPATLIITVDVAEPLGSAAAAVTTELGDAIANRVNRLLTQLGVGGAAQVEWRSSSRGDWLGISVGADVCSYPDGLLDRARAYVTGAPAPLSPDRVREWLLAAFRETPKVAVDVLSHACAWIVALQPEVLIQDQHAAARIAAWHGGEGGAPPPTTMKRRLRALAALCCSVADEGQMGRAPAENATAEEEAIEQLVSDACRGDIEIRLGADVYRSLEHKGGNEQFNDVRQAIFQELGVLFGDVHTVLDPELRPRGACYRINVVDTPAFQVPAPEEVIVNDTAERLRLMNVAAVDTLNVTGQPAAIVAIEHRALLEESGLTIWDQWGLIMLGLAEAIRRNAACFVRADVTGIQINKLARLYPRLVAVVRSSFSDARVSAVLRALVAERVSVRDLAFVLERMVDVRYANDPLCQHLLLDERYTREPIREWTIAETVEFVRVGLRRQVGAMLARGTQTIVVYLIAEKIEQLAVGNDFDASARFEAHRSIAGAVRAEIAHLPPTAQVPVILTEGRARRHLRQILHRTFPMLSFVSFDELAADLNVQPVARIDV